MHSEFTIEVHDGTEIHTCTNVVGFDTSSNGTVTLNRLNEIGDIYPFMVFPKYRWMRMAAINLVPGSGQESG